jgi:phosphoglycerate dehydrogenase-like enzyme
MLEEALPDAEIVIGQSDLPGERLKRGKKLRAIFNVEGNFLPDIDYDYCFAHGIRVLIASPAFAIPVAEAALALALDLARGVSKTIVLFAKGTRSMAPSSVTIIRVFSLGFVRVHSCWA